MLGWLIVELSSRIQMALHQPEKSGFQLSSVWRATFNRIAGLQTKTFPTSTTAQTLYEPPPKESLPYLYPPEPDYANVGIIGMDQSGVSILDNFKLYGVTRRAINCLTLLYIKEDESLIPDVIKKNQDHLVKVILEAAQNPGAGGGEAEPAGEIPVPHDNLQKAKEILTERTIKFLYAWDGYLRENYYVGGVIPNDDLELVAYEAGNAMSAISWGIAATTVPLEQRAAVAATQSTTGTASGQEPVTTQDFIAAWKAVFRQQAVIRLQHQISALSSAFDDVYYLQHPQETRPSADAVLIPLNPDLPSEAIQAVKHSIDYWQRAVDWIPYNLDEIRDLGGVGPAPWSKPMRLALNEQANIWQTLMTGQQSLRAYNMESVTHKIMQDVMEEIQESVRTDFGAGVRQAERAIKEVAQEVKEAIEVVGETAVAGLESLFKSFVRSYWPILGAIVLLFFVLVIIAVMAPPDYGKDTAAAASGGVGITGIISAILGYIGLGNLTAKKTEQQTAVQNGKESAKTMVDTQTATTTAGAAGNSGSEGSLLTRIEGAAQGAGAMVLQAFERGYKQIRIELDGLNRSVAVAYPLVEFFGMTFKLKSDADFLTDIIWSGTERAEDIKQVMRAAFGPLAMLISPSTSGPKDGESADKQDASA
jgi:hypothetical protein